MPRFQLATELPVSAEAAFAWHERPGALERLLPPWEAVEVLSSSGSLQDGARVELLNRLGPIPLRWVVEHHGYEAGRLFHDRQISGPFARWEHRHEFVPLGPRCRLVDTIDYELPGGPIGSLLSAGMVEDRLRRMFRYRHDTTRDDLAAHARGPAPRRVAVTGAGGLLGSVLVPLLTTGGHEVIRLVRREARDGEARWNPETGEVAWEELGPLDALIHLAGENIAGGRWNAERKRRIEQSRVRGTARLAESLARSGNPPRLFLAASAVGYYGDRGEERLTEESGPGRNFLAGVCRAWEAAAAPLEQAGSRVVHARFGMILTPRGGALANMLPAFRACAGGPVGSGRQWWSWISVDDAAGALLHALQREELHGPINVVAPQNVTSAEFAEILGKVLHRPALAPLPAFAARALLGEMADELLLAGAMVRPTRLTAAEYLFRHPHLEAALRHLLGRNPEPTAGAELSLADSTAEEPAPAAGEPPTVRDRADKECLPS